MLVTAGDRPPSVGVHVAHSLDGGASWLDITDAVFSGELAEVGGRILFLWAPGKRIVRRHLDAPEQRRNPTSPMLASCITFNRSVCCWPS